MAGVFGKNIEEDDEILKIATMVKEQWNEED